MLTRQLTASAAALAVFFAAASTSAPAHAQDDPYGSTSTTETPAADAVCVLIVGEGQAGASASVEVSGAPDGQTVEVRFDGQVVATETAPVDAADGPTAELTVPFTVPSVPPGTYTVAAVGATFTAECATADGQVGFEVLAASTGPGGTDGGGSGGGSLVKTGLNVALLLAVAVALLLAGRAAIGASRRRSRSHAGVR